MRSCFKGKNKYDRFDRQGATLTREVMLGIFDVTFDVSSVESAQSTDDGSYDVADALTHWFDTLHVNNTGVDPEHWDRAVCRTAMLATAAQLHPERDASGVMSFVRRHTRRGENQTWTELDYKDAFGKVPELKELTK